MNKKASEEIAESVLHELTQGIKGFPPDEIKQILAQTCKSSLYMYITFTRQVGPDGDKFNNEWIISECMVLVQEMLSEAMGIGLNVGFAEKLPDTTQ